jgi:hypothetical protein
MHAFQRRSNVLVVSFDIGINAPYTTVIHFSKLTFLMHLELVITIGLVVG